MKIDNIEIIYFIDYIGRKVHILEVSKSTQSILNAIGPQFQKELIEKELLLIDVMDFEWLIYALGGLVMAYKDYNLVFVDKTDKKLHSPFIAQSEGY